MCYDSTSSCILGTVGVAVAVYIWMYAPTLRNMGVPYLLLFYSGMEFLQCLQYFVVNHCKDWRNVALTEIAYIYSILHPLVWNIFFYANSVSSEKNIFAVGILLAILWMAVNILMRVLYKPTNALRKEDSWFAGSTTCAKKQKAHVFWEWPSANLGDMNANYFMNLLIWFVPALVSTQFRPVALILIASAVFGAYVSHVDGELFTFASTWCFFSVPIVIACVLQMAYAGGKR